MIAKRLLIFLPFVLPTYAWRWRVGIFPTSALEVFLFVLLATWFWGRGFDGIREGWKWLDSWRGPVIAWILTSLLAVFVSPSWWHAFGLWRAYILEPLMIFLVMADVLRNESDANALRRSCYFAVIALAVWAAFQYATGYGIPHPWNVPIPLGRRATGPFPFPNALSLFVAPLAAYAFVWWMKNGGKLARLTWEFGLLAIILAKSEGGMAAFFITAFFTAMFFRRWRWKAIALAIAAALLIWMVPAWRAIILREITFQGWSGKVRLIMWKETWLMLKDHWFFGVGFGAYPVAIAPYHRATFIEIFQYPHNMLLNLWSEVGLLGIVAFGWIVATWVHITHHASRIIRNYSPIRLLAYSPLAALLIHGFVDVPYFKNDLAVMFWILAALTTLTFNQPQKENAPVAAENAVGA